MSRISVDDYYLNIAKAVSKRSSCLKRQYGAVIVNNKEIIATGYNGAPRGETNCCDVGYCERLNEVHNSGLYDTCRSVHAEQNAIISASRKEMIGGTLYLYGEENGEAIDCEPCPICQRMIKNAGIVKVVTKCERKMKAMLEFGDVIYRPCLSYAGKKKFINTQIVLEIIEKDGKDYIRSVDFVGQKWTDALNDLGGKIFIDKEKARQKLYYMIAEKERQDMRKENEGK